MSRVGDLDELSVLARRGELSLREQRELAEGLALSPTDRLLHDAGCGFDQETSVLVEDEQLVERMTERLLRKRPTPARARWGFAAGMAAGLLLAAAAALGLEAARSFWVRPPLPPASSRVPAVPPALVSRPAPAATAETASAPPEPVSSPPDVAGRAREPAPHAAQPSRAPLASAEPADALFAAANRARSRGELGLSIALYRQLQVEHPASKEAQASHLSLALLQLKQREAHAALEQLQAYRAGAPDAMTAEALFGEAEAYKQLGRRADERRTLQELAERYPNSAYAVAASKRLKQDDERHEAPP